MIESPMEEKVVQQCRGIILDEKDNWRVVSRPYDKFFNIEEEKAAKIDWSTAKIWEKLDGSLMTLYWYDNQWHVSTSGTPDAKAFVGDHSTTFKDLFWQVWSELKYELPVAPYLCYMFELMTPFNRVVVRHEKNRLVHHGARFIIDEMDEHYPYNGGECFGWEIAKNYPLTKLEEVLAAAKELNPLETEGYVVTDHLFRRVKIKSPAYVALHHMISSMSKRKLLEIMRTGEIPEVLSYYPEWAPTWEKIDKELNALVKEAEDYYSAIKSIELQKDFAAKAKEFKHSGALFAVRSGKAKSFQEYFATMNIITLENLLNLEEKETNDRIESSNRSREVSEDPSQHRSDSSIPHSTEASPIRGSSEELPAKD